ncbi:BEL1-like homeodomain protein 4 [Amaranthus tricolor]|uniref:BEL1-like homeodomain protein 4 n=1 Tax=Amaranthus tricolor TaxID=29722 RepID=UPI00258DBA3E|nr:BEL1-like homeodomain protein 4 [Amaranthus tricolor]
MGIAKGAPSVICSSSSKKTNPIDNIQNTSTISMSHEYHQSHPHNNHQQQPSNIFTFPNGFDRSGGIAQQTDHQQPTAAPNSEEGHGLHPVYESAGMLSEMFNFSHGPGPGPVPNQDLLDYRRVVGGMGGGDWYGSSRQVSRDDQIGGISAHDSAAAMQLFLTNPPPKSPSPPPAPTNIHGVGGGGFHPLAVAAGVVHPSSNNTNTNNNTNTSTNFWNAPHINNPGELGGIVEGQGLSLSLSSSLQHLEAAKQVEEFRNIAVQNNDNTHHIMFFNQHQAVGPSSSSASSPGGHLFKNLTPGPGPIQPLGGFGGPNNPQHQVHLAYGSAATSSLGVVNVLRNSKFAKPAQELLEEFCSVGRGQIKKAKLGRQNSSNQNPTSSGGGGGGSGGGGSGSLSATKDPPQLSPSDRIEHQRRKVKLLAMLDEVDRRYNHYCEQMQMVVNSFDLIMGYGAAIPYTALAQKAMSRHFRCLKDAVQVQLKHSCEMLGEKDPTTSSGITKGETPRLKVLEQSLRQQRAFHQMGMMDQEAWRPQRGLPERSVNILRAWLFEHFLHPYPSDADKHLLARQTGLSRNQVSNWFINARVRLWKPMIEEMYQQESKELEEEREREGNQTSSSTSNSFATQQQQHQHQHQHQHASTTTTTTAQNPMPAATSSASTSVLITEPKRSADTMTPLGPPSDRDPSLLSNSISRSHPQQPPHLAVPMLDHSPTGIGSQDNFADNTCHFGGSDNVGPTTMIRFGNTSGDVSLTLGLRHAGNAPEKGAAAFSVRDFAGSC